MVDEAGRVVQVDEYDRALKFYNNLQKHDFFENNEFLENLTEEQRRKKLRKEQILLTTNKDVEYFSDDDEETDEKKIDDEQGKMKLHEDKPIDVINYKIGKLDSIFNSISAVEDEPGLLYVETGFKRREEQQRKKEHDEKQLKLFAGMCTVKALFFKEKTQISMPVSLRLDQLKSAKNTPRLVETYQYSVLSGDSTSLKPLPHDISINDVQMKVFNSILILRRQPHYRRFLGQIYFTENMQRLIIDIFYWCFLERYQKVIIIQQEIFKQISETYVAITYLEMDHRYKETFFKKLADYLAMSVYTIFNTCFPDSYLTQFNNEFKEFVCETCHLWIIGCKPIPRSFSKWNFTELDPESAFRAKEMLQSTARSFQGSERERGSEPSFSASKKSYSNRPYQQSRDTESTYFSSITRKSKTHSIQSSNNSRPIRKSISRIRHHSSVLPKESHPLCASHDIQSSLFNINGHSPLIEYFLNNNKSKKTNKSDVLVQHGTVIDLPPLNAPTYDSVIKTSVKAIKKIEKDIKEVITRQEKGMIKMEADRIRFMQKYKKNQEALLAKPEQVSIMGELLVMSKKKDPQATTKSFGLEPALNKAFKRTSGQLHVEKKVIIQE